MDPSYIFKPKRVLIAAAILASVLEIRKKYFQGFWTYLRSYSFRQDRLLLILALFSTFLMLWADAFLLRHVQAIHGEFVQTLIAMGGFVGKHLWRGLILLYVVAYLVRREKWQTLFFSAFLAGATTGLLAVVLKFTLLRARPDVDLGPFSFFHLGGILEDEGNFQSFPSGDVAIVAGAAAYFVYALKNRYFKGLFFLIPLTTAFSRVILNDHWPSDTLFSIGISYVAARFWWGFKRLQL